jgi:hypothetical protein
MAIVGSAEIFVRAVTSGFKDDVKKGLSGLDNLGDEQGASLGNAFSRAFTRNATGSIMDVFSQGFSQSVLDAREGFRALTTQSYVMGAALTALGATIGALIGGIGVLAGVVLAASPVLLGFGNILGAVAVGAGVLKQVFKGVGEAIGNQTKGIDAATDATERYNDAKDAEADANYAYNQLVKDQAQALKDLEERRNDAANAVADATIASERAERGYQESVKNTEKAIKDVTKAREDAKEAIQQLRFELEGGVISEKKARLEFEKARDSLQRVQDLPPNSRARREAELAFAEADLNLRRAIDKNGDLRKKTAQANKAGVDGSAQVIAAEEKLKKAKEAQGDAEINAAKAVRSVVEAKKELKKIDDSLLPGSERELANARALFLAQRALDEAIEDTAKAKKALDTVMGSPSIAMSPAAKEFVDYIVGLKDRLEELRLKLQENFFEKFNPAIKVLVETYLPILERILPIVASALGEVAAKIAEVFKDPKVIEAVTKVLEAMAPIILALGGGAANLAGGFAILLGAFSPFAVEFAQYVENLTKGWLETIKIKEETGELEKAFDTASKVMYSLFTSIGNTIGAIMNVVKALFVEGGAGWYFLDWLERTTEKWEEFTKLGNENGTLPTFLKNLTINFTKILEIIGLITVDLIKMGATEGFGKFLDSVKIAAENFGDIGIAISENALPAVGRFIEKFSELAKIFVDPLPIRVFFDTLAIAIGVVVTLLDNDFAKAILAVTGTLIAFGLALELTGKSAQFFGKAILGNALLGVERLFKVIPGGGPILTKFRAGMTATIGVLRGLQGATLAAAAPFLLVVAAVVAVIAIFVLAYKESEAFRKAIADLIAVVKDKLLDSFNRIKEALDKVLPSMNTMSNVFKTIGDFLAATLVPLLKITLIAAIEVVTTIIVKFIELVGSIFTKITSAKDAIVGFWDKMKEIWEKMKGLSIGDIFGGLWTSFKKAIEKIIDGWNNLSFELKVPKNKLTEFLNIDGMGFTLNTPNISKAFLNLAKGGIIAPSAGGTLARIAEAGRPERVEPLDPSGLSKRDRAMIEMLAGPAGGINITINPSQGMDERELAALVSRQLAFQLRKGAA